MYTPGTSLQLSTFAMRAYQVRARNFRGAADGMEFGTYCTTGHPQDTATFAVLITLLGLERGNLPKKREGYSNGHCVFCIWGIPQWLVSELQWLNAGSRTAWAQHGPIY